MQYNASGRQYRQPEAFCILGQIREAGLTYQTVTQLSPNRHLKRIPPLPAEP
jgi:hypothetical protein